MSIPVHVQAIIDRNTRNGHTSWQNVALQLGWSVDKVRGLYDHQYLRFYEGCSPSREPEPEMTPEPEDLIEPKDGPETFRSPRPRKAKLSDRILTALERQPMSAETLAGLVGTTLNSAQVTLSRLKAAQAVCHDGRHPYTWSLLERDGSRRTYGSVGGNGTRGLSAIGIKLLGFEANEIANGGRRRTSFGRRGDWTG